ncbi:MAG: prolipoprotein diacylglyceryl transferase [Flavobacteriales bacterium]|nr:prolipoprotein diacylglyceryl transferase [Flavobacteriales bacterium]
MYPTLYHALLDLLGLDLSVLKFVNSFGFFVALAFVAASWTLAVELRRKTMEGMLRSTERSVLVGAPASIGELLTNALVGFLVGWKGLYLALHFAEATAEPQHFLLSGQGSFIGGILLGGLLTGYRWWRKHKERRDEPKVETMLVQPAEHAGNITLTAALWGLVGAKLFHWLENPDQFIAFIQHPSGRDIMSGLTMYGGLIIGGAMVIRYFVRHGIPALAGMDAAAPGLMLAYAVGRMGCQVAGDGDWGIVNTAHAPSWVPQWLWSYDYPNNVNGVGEPITDGTCFPGYCTHLVPPVYPTPLYEILACLLFFGVLWLLRKHLRTPGTLFAVYLMLNGFERFWIEKIRVNVHVIGNVTQAEIISTLLFILGLAGFLWLRRRGLPTPSLHGPRTPDP